MSTHAELPPLNAPFTLALEAAPTGMLLTDHLGKIAFANQHVQKIFGYARDELIGMPIEGLIPARFRPHHGAYRAQFIREPQSRAMGAGRDLYGLRKDGTEVPVEIGLNPIQTAAGTFVLSSIVDISERRRSLQELEKRETELIARLKERDVLLQEIHHRVKNNLQVISSLINMQARKLNDGAGKEILRECRSRIEAIALIHEKLYQSRDYSRIPFSDYLRSLAQSVLNAADISGVDLEFDVEDILLDVHQAIPCGLIFNELITNALKHAFTGQASGSIRITFKRADGSVHLIVKDDGIGINVPRSPTQSLGLQLVTTLTDQLGGHCEITSDGGTTVLISFPEAPR
jgi:two-component system, sensor histidine kinase PdtaS